MFDPQALAIVAAVFLIAGMVKGVIGLGLPTVSLALLTATIGLQPAMALMLAPSFVTNLWQGATGGQLGAILRRLWPFLGCATVTIWLGAALSAPMDVAILSALLGVLLVVYAAIGLGRPQFSLPPGSEVWSGPLAGGVNGVLTGMTGSFVVPGVPYMQALGLPRDMLVQAMGVLFTLSTLALGLAMAGRGLLDGQLGLGSVLAILPALAGMALGQRLRAGGFPRRHSADCSSPPCWSSARSSCCARPAEGQPTRRFRRRSISGRCRSGTGRAPVIQ